jgi:transposase
MMSAAGLEWNPVEQQLESLSPLFVNDACIPLDNNHGERLMRDPAVGRKNHYGSGSEWSGRLAIRLFSIFATLKLRNINPRRWLMLDLEACGNSGGKAPADVSQFLPWNMSPDRLSELQNSTIAQRQMDSS